MADIIETSFNIAFQYPCSAVAPGKVEVLPYACLFRYSHVTTFISSSRLLTLPVESNSSTVRCYHDWLSGPDSFAQTSYPVCTYL